MRPRENIEKVIKKFNIDVNPKKDQEIFDELLGDIEDELRIVKENLLP